MPFVAGPADVRIRYDERGPSDAQPLVLAHGFTVSLEMWVPQLEALSQDYRLITWDARGHGGSYAPTAVESYSMPGLASDLRLLLEGLDAVDGAIIGGMSFGGMIALQYAHDHPRDLTALVLSDTTTRGPVDPSGQRSGTAATYAGDPGIEGGMHAMSTRPDLTAALPDLDIPTLVIVGEQDDMILGGLPRLIEGLPRRRVVRLAGCVHGTSGQRPRDWNASVLAFLADVAEGAALGEDVII